MSEERKREDQADETHENEQEERPVTAIPPELEEAINDINDELRPKESEDMWMRVFGLDKRNVPSDAPSSAVHPLLRH